MQALKVTFKFAAPILRDSDHPIHLDGLVANSMMRELEELGSQNPWEESSDLSSVFERAQGLGDAWVWKASMLKFNPARPREWVNQIRKCDPYSHYEHLGVYWKGRMHKYENGIKPESYSVDTKSGHLRGYQWLQSTQWMESACAWAVGDRDALEHYLSKIDHVGKKFSNGYGRVSSICVEEASQEESDNWSIRVIADGIDRKPGVQYEPVMSCLRAPYWKKLNRVMAFEPVL